MPELLEKATTAAERCAVEDFVYGEAEGATPFAIHNATPQWTRTRRWTKALTAFKIRLPD